MRAPVMRFVITAALPAACGGSTGPASPPSVRGTWQDEIVGSNGVCVLFRLDLQEVGDAITGAFQNSQCNDDFSSPDSVSGLQSGDSVHLDIGGAAFAGRVSADGNTLSGTLVNVPFIFSRK